MQHDHVVALARELSLAGFADTLDRQSCNPIYTEMPLSNGSPRC